MCNQNWIIKVKRGGEKGGRGACSTTVNVNMILWYQCRHLTIVPLKSTFQQKVISSVSR